MTAGWTGALHCGLAALILGGCGGDTEGVTIRTGTPGAERACAAAVDRQTAGTGAYAMDSDHAETGTTAEMRGADGTAWRCTATNAGVVTELSAG